MNDKQLIKFFEKMYSEFGAHSVVTFVLSRQELGQLPHVKWTYCNDCEFACPYLQDTCLVCGGD